MAILSINIIDGRGKAIIARSFRADSPASICDDFKTRVIQASSSAPPFLHLPTYSITYVRHADIYLVAAMTRNANAGLVVSFLAKLIQVFTEYFKKACDESIRDNFVVVYELLDEMADFGYPQISDSQVLKRYITQKHHVYQRSHYLPVANAISWRPEGVTHKRNEVFLDVIENVNVTISGAGNILRSEVVGRILVKSYLSGMPELRLGLNDKLDISPDAGSRGGMEDVKFHQCVRLDKFETERTILFVPPDGTFELMSYRKTMDITPVIHISASIEQHPSHVDIALTATCQSANPATAVAITVPVLPDAVNPKFKSSQGKVKYDPKNDAVIWSTLKLKPRNDMTMKGAFSLPLAGREKGRDAVTRRPIQVKFEVPYQTVSGLQVRFLKVIEQSNYVAFPWVRYITQSGDYQVRLV
mmetsp:Transcript_4890/g.11898  ORF Transcript_4890/g.11898 Transcript_4890/m.11898 type:complete len:416 (-) Transcript_4890:418-1665(-)|eukprot:CAMPEP_0184722398 /NCGR_PEP_ID=MMETSP0314-20130426/21988_1 /TAXON_ID=38298 /ORGANISM="Rhodella maculata, Strain CCMP 736" /LENGTH=415 /DNA_ID=CAMNT_0027186985 /DNA_START=47 /DNA_END=1294 /DNA_ORIENTATION=+